MILNWTKSNCQGSIILDILRYARIKPQVLQVELHPYLTQEPLVKLVKELGIALTAYSSFGPQGYVELGMDRGAPSLFAAEPVTRIAQKHGKTPPQVLLRWATQRKIAVIPKSNTQRQWEDNLNCDSFDLDEAELKGISALNINMRVGCSASKYTNLNVLKQSDFS